MENIADDSFTSDNVEDMETVTLDEVVETQQSLFDDACAVLGASDDKNCTYAEGYLRRQALYACLTCIPEARSDPAKRAGVCLACTYYCHDGHELVELYTKRNFRCDCGNSKFPNHTCNLYSEKDVLNDLNQYNQNFSGVYCTCARPYPDPDESEVDEMIQCIICEDWYHSKHLGVEGVPSSFAEMVCRSCVEAHEFLLHYDGLTITKIVKELNEDKDVNIEHAEINHDSDKDVILIEQSNSSCKKPKEKSNSIGAKFMKDVSWRQQLCTCEDCTKDYNIQNVAYLVDIQDTVQLYEDKGAETVLKKEEDALNSVGRVPLLEAIAGFNDMKEHLVEYLKKFAESKKVVREEDIREFFSGMDARKKQKTSPSVSHFCR